ncbi:unnamed protein product, partial [Mesorhabditis belari]|uniref:Acyltransferase n=1 Tax=Mesorhabditis belari TaxID=2138241 RepID=A0AAF3J751_9BILA
MKKFDEEKLLPFDQPSIHLTKTTIAQTRQNVSDFRQDIALLRALAILAVLGYHFWPSIFPEGFLGVDLFFVISGYLMIVVLDRSKLIPHHMIVEFYYKRVKRICPLYYLIVFITGFFAMFVYSASWAQQYFSYYLPSNLLTLNLRMVSTDGDYFEEGTVGIPFLHFWSLAVEMQFYIVAPIIFLCSKMQVEGYRCGWLIMLIILVISLKFRLEITPITAFYHPFARLWQFLIGMLASFWTEEITSKEIQQEQPNRKLKAIAVVSLVLTFVVFLPVQLLDPRLIQIFVTIMAGVFMKFAPHSLIDWSKFRLNYLGEISYALYLIHYPVLSYSKYLASYYDLEENIVKCLAFVMSFLLSALVHHFYEKPMLVADRKTVFKEILKFLILSLLISWKWASIVHPECAMKSIVEENRKAYKTMYKLEEGVMVNDAWKQKRSDMGHYQYKNGTGKYRVVVSGNSWASQQTHIVREILQNDIQTMDMFAIAASAVPFDYVKGQSEGYWKFVEESRPQIVFILLRYVQGHLKPLQKNDKILELYLNATRRLSKFADHIFIESHQPYCPKDITTPWASFLRKYVDVLEKGGDPNKMVHRDFDPEAFDNHAIHKRLAVVLKECPKCHLINVAEQFIDRKKGKIVTFDAKTQMAYVDNDCHLTPTGLNAIKKPFRETIQRALNLTDT